MSNEFKRTDRIAEAMRRELATILQQEVIDPRLPKLITLLAVKVSKDLGHAKIYFTAFDKDPVQIEVILNSAAGYLRMLLAKEVKLRVMPQLHFIYDQSVEYGNKLSRLIEEVNADSSTTDKPNQDDES